MIRIEDLKKTYDDVTPLKGVSTTINDGDVISIIGPSGTGKSTFLRCINLLEKPTSGRIWIDDDEITDPECDLERIRQKMGMVFQSFNLFGHLNVIENIMLSPVTLLNESHQQAYDKGMELLRTVGLAQKAQSFPDELSGGQKQRIAIARTLAMDPKIILMDEPTSALDPTMVGEVQSVIRQLAETQKTLIIVTHEMSFAKAICNRIFYMDEGGIYEEGTPDEIFDSPKREKTKRFVQRLKVLEFDIDGRDYDFPAMETEIGLYNERNQIPRRTSRHIELVFEELVHQNLGLVLDKPKIHVTIEYSAKDEKASFLVDYAGDRYNVLKSGDPLSLSMVNSVISDASYSRDDSADLGNHLRFNIL